MLQGWALALINHFDRVQDAFDTAEAGFEAALAEPETLADEARQKPEVLLVHGNQDEVVPFASMQEAGNALTEAGFTVYGHVMEGTGHGIAPDGLSVALAFMRDKLGLE